MSNEPKTILISRKPGTPCDDAVAFVYSIGGVPLEHDLGSVPAVDFETLSAALIVVVGQFEAAASQTNRWRVELGDRFRPIVWILDSDESVDGRPDACLVRPIDFALAAAQLRAFERIQIQVEGLRDRAGEVGALAEKLSLAHDLRRRDQSLAHATLHLAPTRPREIGSLRFGYFHELYPTGDPSLLDIATDGDRVHG